MFTLISFTAKISISLTVLNHSTESLAFFNNDCVRPLECLCDLFACLDLLLRFYFFAKLFDFFFLILL